MQRRARRQGCARGRGGRAVRRWRTIRGRHDEHRVGRLAHEFAGLAVPVELAIGPAGARGDEDRVSDVLGEVLQQEAWFTALQHPRRRSHPSAGQQLDVRPEVRRRAHGGRVGRAGSCLDDLDDPRVVARERLRPGRDRRYGGTGMSHRADAHNQCRPGDPQPRRDHRTDEQHGPIGQRQHPRAHAAPQAPDHRSLRRRGHHQQRSVTTPDVIDEHPSDVVAVEDAVGVRRPAARRGPAAQLERVDVVGDERRRHRHELDSDVGETGEGAHDRERAVATGLQIESDDERREHGCSLLGSTPRLPEERARGQGPKVPRTAPRTRRRPRPAAVSSRLRARAGQLRVSTTFRAPVSPARLNTS